MDIAKIEVLLRAIELGSLSKAAEEYLYTPSAVSHIVNNIEDEIGERIIKRSPRGIEVEDGCEEIIENLKKLVSIKNQITELVASKNKRKNTLVIGTYSSLSKYILPGIIKEFKKKFPDTDINIVVDDKMKLVYENYKADILFGEKLENDNIIWEELIADPYVALLPKSYNFSGNSIRRQELSKRPFIMANDSKISKYMNESTMEDIVKIDSSDDSSVIQMVKEGMGVTILPSLSVGNDKNIVSAELSPKLSRVLGLMYREKDFKEKEYVRKFVKYIRQFDFQKQ